MAQLYTEHHRQAIADDLQAEEWIRQHLAHGAGGPFDGVPTSDPGVQVLCRTLRHLKADRRRLDAQLYAPDPFTRTQPDGPRRNTPDGWIRL